TPITQWRGLRGWGRDGGYIGTLAGGIAHDFNNLMMGIQGNVSLLRRTNESNYPDRKLELIEQSIQDASHLTRQLLSLARGGKYDVKPTDLSRVAHKTMHLFASTNKQLSLGEDFADGLWSTDVDRSQMEQLLLNLLVNAAQAMPNGGDVAVETQNVTLAKCDAESFQVEPGRYVKLVVTDTGAGMDEETSRRCFDPFFTTKGIGRGTGLGLASVYGIVRNHAGFVDVISTPGQGSSFRIFLPASNKLHEEETELTDIFATGKETVLIVDDEPMILEVAGEMLQVMGYRVLTVGSGKEAIELFKERGDQIDVVILDTVMPDMGGSETFDALRDLDPEIRVLLTSGYSVDGEAKHILDRGCNGFIQKPFKMELLSQLLRQVLDSP
ncbi:MAG: response regulator, partial [Proteobacteria bacterium]|nr:response regulator [Pseudomonadota bacterium]